MLDWQTEEDQDWNEPHMPPPTAVSLWRRRLVWLVLLGLVLGIGGWYGAGLVQERVDTATSETEADLRQTHALLREAVLNQDRELFTLLISGRDTAWAAAQEKLLAERQLLHRSEWGLTLEPYLFMDDQVQTVTLSPDLLSAEVTAFETYRFWSVADQDIRIAVLTHTAVYRLGPDRWLYAPPEPDFWGETAEIYGSHLHITYPKRDQAVIERLFPNLDALVANTCRLPGLGPCDPVQVDFSTDPALVGLRLTDMLLNAEEPIQLPTPTLLGVPQNEAGHEILWLTYGRFLSSALITQQTDYVCCRTSQLYFPLLHYQLAQLDLLNWPFANKSVFDRMGFRRIEPALFNNMWQFNRSISIVPAIDIIRQPGDNIRSHPPPNMLLPYEQRIEMEDALAYAFIDYLTDEWGQQPAELQRQLRHHADLFSWLNQFVDASLLSEQSLQLNLMDYISSQGNQFQPQIPLTLTCDPNGPAPRLIYDPTTRTWQERPLPPLAANVRPEPIFRYIHHIHPTPYEEIMVLETAVSFYLATPDLLRPITYGNGLLANQGTLYLTAAPHDQLLHLTLETLQRNQRFTVHYQLDPTACDDEQCPATIAPGQIDWSPNGRYTLITINEWQALDPGPGLYLGDEQGNVVTYLGDHYDRLRPVWLDDTHIAYPSLDENQAAHYTILAINDPPSGPVVLQTITSDDLAPLVAEAADIHRPIQPIGLIAAPDNPRHLLVQAAKPWIRGQVGSGVAYEQYYLFGLRLTGDLTQIEEGALLRQSADGPLMAQFYPARDSFSFGLVYVDAGPQTTISLIDLPILFFDATFNGQQGTWPLVDTLTTPPPAWSPDGLWLATAFPFGLLLTNIYASSNFHLAPYDLSNCTTIQWVEQRD